MNNRFNWLIIAAFLLVIAIILLFVIEERRIASTSGFPLDDAWIFWVFAKNLATGQGFSFNPGEPVLGVTSILWVLILAVSYLLSHNTVLLSKLWGVAFFLGTILLTYKICTGYTHKQKIALIGVLAFASIPPLVWGILSGMETSLTAFLLISTLFFHLRKKETLALLFCALSFMARPELIILFPLLILDDHLNKESKSESSEDQRTGFTFWQKVILFAIFISPYFLFNFFATGSFLPHTFAAKTLDSGLIWAAGNKNLDELVISFTLDPYVWGGSILMTLVFLNVFWAFFWGPGLLFSFLDKKRLIYPLIFLAIPIARGISAPVGSSFFGEHRYVAFLFPLLAIFFVIGWEHFKNGALFNTPVRNLKRWLFAIGGFSLFLCFLTYLNPLIKKNVIFSLVSRYYFPAPLEKHSLALITFADFQFMLWLSIFFILGISYLIISNILAHPKTRAKLAWLFLFLGIFLQLGFLVNQAQRYGLSVKNINEMQVHLGKWAKENIPSGSLVAINDVGAIKFFGERNCLDLEGLVYHQTIPYKILGQESYVLYLNKNRPAYFIIFPSWYPALVKSLRTLEKPIYQVRLNDNIACGGGGFTIVAQPDWEFFDSTFQKTGLLEIEPYLPAKSFKKRWYDSQERMGFVPDWRDYFIQGKSMQREGNLKEAEKLYQKAASFNPGNYELHWQLALLYKEMGNQFKAAKELEKSIKERLFPPPDFQPKIR
jgi:hypothetical protein